jgi:hypothetical protein
MSIQVHVRVFSLHLVLLLLLLLHHLLLLLLGELLDLLWCPAPLSVLTRLECPKGQNKQLLSHCGTLHFIWCHPISQATHGSELILSGHHLRVPHQLSILVVLTHALYML